MSQPPSHLSDDTSDRLYTPEELAAFAREQAEREAVAQGPGDLQQAGPQDPAGDRPDATAATPQPTAQPPAQRPDPLTDPLPGSGEPRTITPASGPPPTRPQPPPPPVRRPPPPPPPPARGGPGAATRPATPPAPVRPAQPPAQPATQPSAQSSADSSGDDPQVRRFMTATDFLERRAGDQPPGPATWGWRGKVRRLSGGLITPRMGPAERAYTNDRALIQKDFDGPRTIAFINPKGGAAKTTGVLAAGYTFGNVRGGGVVAWDNNETRGTLGIRGSRSSHTNTTRELLEHLDQFKDVHQSRIGDLGAYVRNQGDAHFDVLASDERPDVTGQIHASDFRDVHQLLERFYRIILVDTGNNMRAENWLAAADAADLLVVTSTVREDTGYSGLWMLDALQDAGYQNLKYKAVTVLSDPSPTVDHKLAADLVEVYQQRTRGVYRVPYDPALVAGSVLPYNQLSEATRRSWLRACAAMAAAL